MAPTIEERLAFLESTLVGVQQNVTGVASDVANIQANDDGTGSAIFLSASDADTFWLIWAGVTVFFMQCGFGMLEAGNVRLKNTKNILLKNLLDACLGAIIWYVIGYAVAVRRPPARRARGARALLLRPRARARASPGTRPF